MGLVIGVPLAVALHRIFTCPEGKVFAVKELVANLYLRMVRRSLARRFDIYDISSETDPQKTGILYPNAERHIEHRRDTRGSCDNVLIFGVNPCGDKLLVRLSIAGNYAKAIVILKIGATKKEYVLPKEELHRIPRSGKDLFVGGGLRIRCLLPMRKWRITFNGLLRETSSITPGEEHVKFNFLWTASSDVFDSTSDIHVNQLSYYLAHQKWKGWLPNSSFFESYLDEYEQSGYLMGTLVTNQEEELELHLWGYRLRSLDYIDSPYLDKASSLFGYTEHGDSFHFQELEIRNKQKQLAYGYLIHSNSYGGPIESYEKLSDNTIKVKKGKKKYEVQEKNPENPLIFLESDFCGRKLAISFSTVIHDNGTGTGLRITTTRHSEPINVSKDFEEQSGDSTDLVLNFLDPFCKNPSNSGGKGASLAQLVQLSGKDGRVNVPKGLVITTAAYEHFIDDTNLTPTLKNLEHVVWGNSVGNIKEHCESVVAKVRNSKLSENIKEEVKIKLENLFEKDLSKTRFAVRSSASGEDSEEMSAAGQMDTFLGISGLDNIMEAIVKCWASQFTHIAIQYKRQHGQGLNSPMAVVVQEMVAADVAGVMFTCDPLDGNPARLTITANYGIGESVVSAMAEPDTIVLKRNSDDEIELVSEDIGKKQVKIVMQDLGGVNKEEISESDNKECCLKRDNQVKLARIGISIEKDFGCPLDIEWAIKEKQIFLLQARPITTFDQETDFEIAHETDTFIRSEEDYNSKANVGEVMPGAISTLGSEVMFKSMNISIIQKWRKRSKAVFPFNPYVRRGITISQNHCLFGLMDSILRFYTEKDSMVTKAYMVAIFGRILEDPVMLETALTRNQNFPPSSKKSILYLIKDILCCGGNLKKSLDFFNKYQPHYLEEDDAETTFRKICEEILYLSQPTASHSECTLASSILNLVLLSVLVSANGGWDDKVYSNFAMILSNCKDVESADVPSAIQSLALTIRKDISTTAFKEMSVEEAQTWLQTSGLKSSTEFEKFLKKHGHRCVKEFDLFTKTWEENPTPLIKSLQEMVGTIKAESIKPVQAADTTIQDITIPLNTKQRWILKLIVPYNRRVVAYREGSKSLVVKIIHSSRKAFRMLGIKMASEGRLPDPELIYFLSLGDLEELFRNRSPRLIRKAIRRRNMLPKLENLRFPEIMKGVPQPIRQMKIQVPEGYFSLKGTPVSRGAVRGKARVATSLEEAAKIQKGEILIAYGTDIGWSPYFPLLSGVATELGGLISHGAVVAREYGLPCVVGVHGATDIFKTGDDVYLDGNVGLLKKMDPADELPTI